MKLTTITIDNYKSIDSLSFDLDRSLTVIVGRNNSGKSAILECLKPSSLSGIPHETAESRPLESVVVRNPTITKLLFGFARDELMSVVTTQIEHFLFPAPDGVFAHHDSGQNRGAAAWKRLTASKHLWVCGEWQSQRGARNIHQKSRTPALGRYEPPHDDEWIRVVSQNGDMEFASSKIGDREDSLGWKLEEVFEKRIFVFGAERFSIGESKQRGEESELMGDASNLASVLHRMNRNPERFKQFVGLVRRVFPEIWSVSLSPIGVDHVEILIWDEDPSLGRDHLARPLSKCGTGIAQALAILYVAMNARDDVVVAIDEPSSFLHPGALKVLLSILLEHDKCQYIITTHSPETIAHSNAELVYRVRKVNGKTELVKYDGTSLQTMREALRETGASLSSVFGVEHLVWVEGETEEAVFPALLRSLGNANLDRVKFLKMSATADFDKRKRARNAETRVIVDIYNRLSKGIALFPKTVAILLDSEARTVAERQDATKRTEGAVRFLVLPMLENYLLDVDSIAEYFSSLPDCTPVASSRVEERLGELAKEKQFLVNQDSANEFESPEKSLHGAKVLKELMTLFGGTKCAFSKTKHSVGLAKFISENRPEFIKPLVDELLAVLGEQNLDAVASSPSP